MGYTLTYSYYIKNTETGKFKESPETLEFAVDTISEIKTEPIAGRLSLAYDDLTFVFDKVSDLSANIGHDVSTDGFGGCTLTSGPTNPVYITFLRTRRDSEKKLQLYAGSSSIFKWVEEIQSGTSAEDIQVLLDENQTVFTLEKAIPIEARIGLKGTSETLKFVVTSLKKGVFETNTDAKRVVITLSRTDDANKNTDNLGKWVSLEQDMSHDPGDFQIKEANLVIKDDSNKQKIVLNCKKALLDSVASATKIEQNQKLMVTQTHTLKFNCRTIEYIN